MRDEYFCPNCDAILNNQDGFDPDKGSWTCTECGTHLMDEDVYEGDTFEGVAWYCDSCGALLNRQSGFSDSYASWTCTECYHSNNINEDEIVNNDSNRDKGLFETIRDIANGINDITSTISSLYSNDDSKGDEYDDEYENDDEDEDEDENNDEDYAPRYSSSTSKNTAYKKPSLTSVKSDKELKKIRRKAFFLKKKKIQIGYDPEDLIYESLEEIVILLHNKGFNKISTCAIKDVYVDSKYRVGEIESIAVGGFTSFKAKDMIPYDIDIVIKHHEKKEITIPFSSNSLQKKNYSEVVDKLEDLGFTEIYVREIKDLVTGWITKDGSVEKVTIGYRDSFKKNSTYTYDTRFLIEYHTFKNKK